MLLGETNRLKSSLETADEKLMAGELAWRNERRDLERQNHDLEKMMDKKSKELSDRTKEIVNLNETIARLKSAGVNMRSDDSTEDGMQQPNYEELYRNLKLKHEESLKELEELRPRAGGSKADLEHFELRNNHSFEVDFGKEFAADARSSVTEGD